MFNIETVVPRITEQFDPVKAVEESHEESVVKELRKVVLIEKGTLPILPQSMLYDFTFDIEEAKQAGLIAPQRILGPRRRIKIEDIKPGMAGVGCIRNHDGQMIITLLKDVVTNVKATDGKIQVYSNSEVLRDSPDKQWFIQHYWNYSPVDQIKTDTPGRELDFKLRDGDAEEGDYIMAINLNPAKPSISILEYNENSYSRRIQAHEGQEAMYYLSPRIAVPKLSDEPIPPMPGQPQPQPEPKPEEQPEEGKPDGPPIPPMPGAGGDWERPIAKDWWQSE